MPIAMQCPSCGKQLKIKEELFGKRVKCPSCKKGIDVPARQTPPSPAAPMQDEASPAISMNDPERAAAGQPLFSLSAILLLLVACAIVVLSGIGAAFFLGLLDSSY